MSNEQNEQNDVQNNDWISHGDTDKLIEAVRNYLQFNNMLGGELLHEGSITQQEYDYGVADDEPLRQWLKQQEVRQWLEKHDAEEYLTVKVKH
jgi:hypothetical protein